MTGGLQVQAFATHKALSGLGGVNAELFNWSDDKPAHDLYHFIGFPPYLTRITELVRQAERPYILTMLFGSTRQWTQLWPGKIKQFGKSQILRQRSRYEAVMNASAIVTITEADADAARFIYGIDEKRIHIVPNGIDETFFNPSPALWREKFGPDPFILCVGAIQPRKNQLLLTEICNHLQLPVVLLGPVLPGEKAYAHKVMDAIKVNEHFGGRWIQNLKNEDALFVSAHAACKMFALLSVDETQPLSVMQAMAARKPILLLKAPYTTDLLFIDLPAAPSANRSVVSESLKRGWNGGKQTSLNAEFTWNEVARRLTKIYRSVF
ncbi:MAG: glycosyl transferase group 1 [Verrucomicrobiales bacterium]|nr:glycosyl transferase group 1 [Verrucomicrobiales bacterium]